MARTAIQSVVITAGAVDASGTPEFYFRAPADITLDSIYQISGDDIAADASDIATTTVTNIGDDGTGTAEVGEQTTDSDVSGYAAIEDGVPWEIPIASDAVAEVSEGEVLKIAPTEGGTATSGDLTDACWVINYRVGHGVGYSA